MSSLAVLLTALRFFVARFLTGAAALLDLGELGLATLEKCCLRSGLACGDATTLLTPAAFTEKTGKAHWHVLQRARATETGCFIIAAAQSGTHADGRQTYGHSLIVNPWGQIIAEAKTLQTELVIAEVNLKEVDIARNAIGAWKSD